MTVEIKIGENVIFVDDKHWGKIQEMGKLIDQEMFLKIVERCNLNNVEETNVPGNRY